MIIQQGNYILIGEGVSTDEMEINGKWIKSDRWQEVKQ